MYNNNDAYDIFHAILQDCNTVGLQQLEPALRAGKKLKIKFGCDPTQPDIHLGHCVVLEKLKVLQELGHQIVFIIGDCTALIGDPTGKNVTRPPLALETIHTNAQTYQAQIFQILDATQTIVVYNSTWLHQFTLAGLLPLFAKMTIAQLLNRQDFKGRLQAQKPIGIHEIIYPILQAYDSVHLKSDLEIGGEDQLFNLLLGRELQTNYQQIPQAVVTVPLMLGTDGHKKMSKSLHNAIHLQDPYMFAKIMSLSDALMAQYIHLLHVPLPNPATIVGARLKDLKMALATYITERYQGAEAEKQQRALFLNVVSTKQEPLQTIELQTSLSSMTLIQILKTLKLVESTSQAKRLITQKAIDIDHRVVNDINYLISIPSTFHCKIGKKLFTTIKTQLT